ncbi:MAG TPA: DUF4870 domain-containing protein [Pyrinomonadaceae bacterium]
MQNPPPVQTAPATAKSSTGLDENVAALLSYITWVPGLIFFLIEKDSRLVRFHAMQSLLLNGGAIVVGIVLWILSFVLLIITAQISGLLSTLLSIISGLVAFVFFIGILIAVILCLIKAYQGQYFKLPIVGNFAEKFSAK